MAVMARWLQNPSGGKFFLLIMISRLLPSKRGEADKRVSVQVRLLIPRFEVKKQKRDPRKVAQMPYLQGSPGVHDRIRTCGPSAPEADALSSWATWTYSILSNAQSVIWTANLLLRSHMRRGQALCSGGTYSIQLSYMDIFSFYDALMTTWTLSIPPRAFFSEGLLVSSGGRRSIQLSYGRI